jgi:hypothetical protein
MNRAIKIALLALAFLPLTYLAEAAISLSFVPRASASLPSGLFVDPRDFTATCDGDTTGAHDDAPGFRLALATHLPVVIPYPGCEWITQVPAIKNGDKIFSFGGSGPYDDLGSGTTPRIFIPSIVAATNNCAFDVAGFEGVTLENVTFNGWDRDIGTVAICNSGGVGGGRPQAFTHIINVSCSNVGTCIGAPTLEVASSDPTYCNIDTSGGLNTPVFQMDIRGLMTGHVCWSIYANFSDTHIDSIYMANNYNSCIAADTGAGVLLEIVNLRCEYSGHFDGHAVVLAGASIYIAGFGKAHLTNGFFDHTFGSCVRALKWLLPI